ncbi:hypothetical protein OF83DRAFT_716708 [Amylostereum chailletii]|nr:hypothetical protein OF83DRAFT_716708 [Amylostereum chailletii]
MTAVWYIIKELRSEYPKLFWWDDVFAGDVESVVGAQGHGSPISALMALKNDHVHAVALAAHSLVALAVHISHEQIRRHRSMDVAYSGPSISSYVRQYMCAGDMRRYCDEYGNLVRNGGLVYTTRFIKNILPHLLNAPSDWDPSMTWHVVDVIAGEIEPRQVDMPVRDAFMKLWRSALEERHRREKALDPSIGKRLQRLLGAMRRIHDALAEVQSPGQEETTLQEMNSQLE